MVDDIPPVSLYDDDAPEACISGTIHRYPLSLQPTDWYLQAFLKTFSSRTSLKFWFKFNWNMSLGVQLTKISIGSGAKSLSEPMVTQFSPLLTSQCSLCHNVLVNSVIYHCIYVSHSTNVFLLIRYCDKHTWILISISGSISQSVKKSDRIFSIWTWIYISRSKSLSLKKSGIVSVSLEEKPKPPKPLEQGKLIREEMSQVGKVSRLINWACHLGPLLLIWFEYNPSMYKELHPFKKCGMKSLIHSQTSTAQPWKFGNG